MKVTLPKDLELYGVRHLAGTEVDIEPEVYEKVMQSVVAERIIERAQLEEQAEKKVKGAKK